MMNYKISRLKPFGTLLEPVKEQTNIADLDINFIRSLLQQEQLVLLRGFDTFKSSDDFTNYCECWGEISIWPFGKILELIEQEDPKDHIFDNNYVPLHWDGMYRPQVPEYQIFRCVKAPLKGQGGRTTFSNTLLALQKASPEIKAIWNKVTGIYEREMQFYHSRTVSPIISKHPYQDFSVIRYNEPPSPDKGQFINPPSLDFKGLRPEESEFFHQSLQAALYSPENFYAHEWQSGDIVIADNFSLLHGREAYLARSPRHLQRVHILSNPPFNNPGLESYK